MNTSDRNLLRLMLDAMRESLAFAAGRTRADLDTDRQLVLSLLKSVEIIGDIAEQVSDAGQAELPDIPWVALMEQSNSVTGIYFHINLDALWLTVTKELPPVVSILEQIIATGDKA